jgi:hypothetical protein
VDAIAWSLGQSIAMIRGPPGTGKTKSAALLIAVAIRLRGERDEASRVLAVAHSNGAADVLLAALLQMGLPAIRVGRPANVSPELRHRTVVALAERHPAVVALRNQTTDSSLDRHVRASAELEMKGCIDTVRQMITNSAQIVVASCVGAFQLLDVEQTTSFPLVVCDEASQTTEPALLCALAASKAEQVIFLGDTRQLPPTVATNNNELRSTLGVSPMARLETFLDQKTLREQYRMPPGLLEFPSRYFYEGIVNCANEVAERTAVAPCGFPWPTSIPLAFIQVGTDLEVVNEFGGRSNPVEQKVVIQRVLKLLEAKDVEPEQLAIISPYSQQVHNIRAELLARNVHSVRVGTIDSMQGSESDVVIFSAVRSNELKELGFLRDSRRLNVAITRARRGLILIGDQRSLRTCRHWNALLDSCQKRGCFMDVSDLEAKASEQEVENGTLPISKLDLSDQALVEDMLQSLNTNDDDGLDGLFTSPGGCERAERIHL